MLEPVELSRLKWRSRRGMLENDLVLTVFFERHERELDRSLASGLGNLLELPDGDLWDLISARTEPDARFGAPTRLVLDELRRCRVDTP